MGTTSKTLRVAVVGAGLGGLAAANAFHRRGFNVSVYEQAPALGEVGAGIFVYPNSLRQLERMGFAKALKEVGPESVLVRCTVARTGVS